MCKVNAYENMTKKTRNALREGRPAQVAHYPHLHVQ